jgi:tRNA-dihydrouridine synthase A
MSFNRSKSPNLPNRCICNTLGIDLDHMQGLPPHRFSVAPMMECTDRHCRAFHRVLTRQALLYTEMVTAAAVVHGDVERLLGFDPAEQPVALQLGGSEPRQLAEAARIGEGLGYREINLNCGCPSTRVHAGRFGACLMAEPLRVAECVEAMQAAVSVPVTVKCRIGIDDQDSEDALSAFVAAIADAGCRTVIVHARKAWLKGLSPKQNRVVPPLDHGRVHRLKQARPDLVIILNGGVQSLDEALGHLRHVDGVMLGRAAYERPWLLADVDRLIFGRTNPVASREAALLSYLPYVEARLARGVPLATITRHLLGLFHGEPGGRQFRRVLSESAHRSGADTALILRALESCTRVREAA